MARGTCSPPYYQKKTFHTAHFTLVRLKPFCTDSSGKCDTLKDTSCRTQVIDDQDKFTLEENLMHKFETKMKNDAYPLFTDYDTYKKWLPVRYIDGDYRELYKLPHYTDEHDLDLLVKKLEEGPREGGRADVKYIATPSGSGKSCAILPAFLRSAEKKDGFTHYIAFHNNHHRTFKVTPYQPVNDRNVAYIQGDTFIINCLEKILHDEKHKSAEEFKSGFMIDINLKDEKKH